MLTRQNKASIMTYTILYRSNPTINTECRWLIARTDAYISTCKNVCLTRTWPSVILVNYKLQRLVQVTDRPI